MLIPVPTVETPSEPVPDSDSPEDSMENSERQYVCNEILATEKNYLLDLLVIQEVFRTPLMKSHLLSQEQIDSIFDPVISAIISVSESMVMRISYCIESDMKMGALFLQSVDLLAPYSQYVNTFDDARDMLFQLRRSNDALNTFFLKAEKDPRCNHFCVNDFLMVVIQRIPRYVILLQNLLKHTSERHSDYRQLKEAIQKIKDVAFHINQEKHKYIQIVTGQRIKQELGLGNSKQRFIHEEILLKTPFQKEQIGFRNVNKVVHTACRLILFCKCVYLVKIVGDYKPRIKKYSYSIKNIFGVGKNNDTLIEFAGKPYYTKTPKAREELIRMWTSTKAALDEKIRLEKLKLPEKTSVFGFVTDDFI